MRLHTCRRLTKAFQYWEQLDTQAIQCEPRVQHHLLCSGGDQFIAWATNHGDQATALGHALGSTRLRPSATPSTRGLGTLSAGLDRTVEWAGRHYNALLGACFSHNRLIAIYAAEVMSPGPSLLTTRPRLLACWLCGSEYAVAPALRDG